MKKVTVVRQNRCDKEMMLLLFGCFFFYFAMQLFVGVTDRPQLVNAINMALYLVFVPGFAFRTGYRFRTIQRLRSEEQGKKEIFGMVLCSYAAFFVLAVLDGIARGGSFGHAFFNTLTLLAIPGSAAVFFMLALLLLLAGVFYRQLQMLAGKKRVMVIAVLAFALCSFLKVRGEGYAITAALFGVEGMAAVPAIPYVAYFLLGMWFEEQKPGFSWKLFGAAVILTVAALLLYRTPAQELCRLCISALPVYLVYVISEVFSDLTLRFYSARFVTDTVELVFAAYAAVLAVVYRFGLLNEMDVKKTLLLAVGVLALLYGLILGVWVFAKLYEKAGEVFAHKVKHPNLAYFLIYTVVFTGLFCLAFIDFFRFGRTLLWKADTVSQYYPRAVFFADYIAKAVGNLLQGRLVFPMYDFRIGMGGEVTYSLEPLYFLFALFGRENVEKTYILLIFLRFYLSGLSASAFCLYFKKNHVTAFLASLVYVFCGFSFYGGARHTMFMVQMIFFPLLIIAIEEIIRKRRWYLCTILVALSLFSNYYFLYMSTIGMGIYFLVRFFCQPEKKDRSLKNFIGRGLVISGSYLLGVAMSCIVLVTTFGLYVGSGRSGSAVIKTPSLFYYHAKWLLSCFLCFPTTANSPGDWLKLGYLPIAFLAVVFLFTRKGRKELKIFSVLSVILMALPLSGFVFNGFSSISNRWCYMLSLLVAYIVADCLEDMCNMSRRELLICAGMTLLYGYLVFFGDYSNTRYMKAAFLCIAATYAGLLLCQERSRQFRYVAKQSILLLMTMGMVVVNGHLLYSGAGVVREYTEPGEAQQKSEDTPLRAISQVEDDNFYRATTPKLNYSTISSSIMLDYNSISMFNSTLNGSIMEYLEKMGSTGYSVTQLFGLSNRTFLNALAAVKYYAYYDSPKRPLPYGYETAIETDLDGKQTTVSENQYALPIGYTYTDAISREELEKYDTLKRQEVLMQRVMLENLDDQGTADIGVTQEPLDFTVAKEDGLYYNGTRLTTKNEEETETEGIQSDEEEPSGGEDEEQEQTYTLTLNLQTQPDSETYLVLKNAVLKGNMTETPINISFQNAENKLSYKFRSDDDRYGTRQQDYVFNLGYHEDAFTTCEISFDRAGTISFDSMELYSQPMENYPDYIGHLTEDVLEDVTVGEDEVTGNISLDEDKYLVLSIPYQKGWTAYVDGEETELLRANYMYMALPLSAGEHSIRLTFAIPGVRYAMISMPSAAGVFVLLLLVRWLRRKRRVKDCAAGNEE